MSNTNHPFTFIVSGRRLRRIKVEIQMRNYVMCFWISFVWAGLIKAAHRWFVQQQCSAGCCRLSRIPASCSWGLHWCRAGLGQKLRWKSRSLLVPQRQGPSSWACRRQAHPTRNQIFSFWSEYCTLRYTALMMHSHTSTFPNPCWADSQTPPAKTFTVAW